MALALEISIGLRLAKLDAVCEVVADPLLEMSTIVLLAVALNIRVGFTQIIHGKFSIFKIRIAPVNPLPNR